MAQKDVVTDVLVDFGGTSGPEVVEVHPEFHGGWRVLFCRAGRFVEMVVHKGKAMFVAWRAGAHAVRHQHLVHVGDPMYWLLSSWLAGHNEVFS